MKKIIIVGGGLSGCTMAYLIKQKYPYMEIMIIEKEQIGGLCKTYNKEGINYELGPHVLYSGVPKLRKFFENFLCNNEKKYYQYLSVDGRLDNLYHFPVTTQDVVNYDASAAAELYQINLDNPDYANFENYLISRVGKTAYEVFYKQYNIKQWAIHPKDMDCNWARQRGMMLNNNVKPVFGDKWQGHPGSYNSLFEGLTKDIKIIKAEVISVDHINPIVYLKGQTIEADFVINTGPIDLMFSREAQLSYRGICWVFALLNIEYALPTYLLSFPNTYKFTRIMEYKHQTGQSVPKKTLISFDYPYDGFTEVDVPVLEHIMHTKHFLKNHFPEKTQELFFNRKSLVYPVLNKKNDTILNTLIEKVAQNPKILTLGRLGLYSYISMDTCVDQCFRAIDLLSKWQNLTTEERIESYQKLRERQT